jgi:hypothetical protein
MSRRECMQDGRGAARSGSCGGFGFGGFGPAEACVFEPVALACDGEDLGVMEESVEDGTGGGNVLEELAPLFDRPVAGHDGGSVFIPPHDDLEEVLSRVPGELFEPHVID